MGRNIMTLRQNGPFTTKEQKIKQVSILCNCSGERMKSWYTTTGWPVSGRFRPRLSIYCCLDFPHTLLHFFSPCFLSVFCFFLYTSRSLKLNTHLDSRCYNCALVNSIHAPHPHNPAPVGVHCHVHPFHLSSVLSGKTAIPHSWP